MDKVKTLVDAGTRVGFAIRQALLERELTVSAFAEKNKLNEKAVSSAIHGSVRATDAVVEALAKELGGSPEEWRMLLWKGAMPIAEVKVGA